ncbi:MAG: hypothetical protein HY047_10705 [Acidobacteria bacterium]|nr:hypothetical protein [Acidobacteriota bacterium]
MGALIISNFLTALTSTVLFKLALFAYSTSGAEGATSWLLIWPRLALCLGWDVMSAAMVAALATITARPLAARFPRAAFAASSTVQALYGVFLLVSFHVALIVGAPLDKAAIDLLFFYNATPGRGGQLMVDSVAPYLTTSVEVETIVALALPLLALGFWSRRAKTGRGFGRRLVLTLAVFVFLTLVAVPGLANGVLAVHTFGLERSPLTMLVGSYARGPLRARRRPEAPQGDPYCFDLQSPVPVDGANPLKRATPARTNLVLILLESISTRSLEPAPTPMAFLDELARSANGVRFDNHYAHWAQTMNAAFNNLVLGAAAPGLSADHVREPGHSLHQFDGGA